MLDPTYLAPQPQDAPLQPFDEFSRYRGSMFLVAPDAQGRDLLYVARRFLPQPETLAEVGAVIVREGDRLDVIAAQQFGEARWWWRLADANGAVDPTELTARPGQRLRLTLTAGMPAPR